MADDDVVITDVDDGDVPLQAQPANLKNPDLSSLGETAAELLSQYGWYLMLVTVLVYLLVQYLSKKTSTQRARREQPQDAAVVVRNQEAMEAARRRMQDELDAKAVLFKEKQKQQEEEKRRQKIESYEAMRQGRSYRPPAAQPTEEAGAATTLLKAKTDKKTLRSADYNPLAGQGGGGSCSYRPPRRGPSSGG